MNLSDVSIQNGVLTSENTNIRKNDRILDNLNYYPYMFGGDDIVRDMFINNMTDSQRIERELKVEYIREGLSTFEKVLSSSENHLTKVLKNYVKEKYHPMIIQKIMETRFCTLDIIEQVNIYNKVGRYVFPTKYNINYKKAILSYIETLNFNISSEEHEKNFRLNFTYNNDNAESNKDLYGKNRDCIYKFIAEHSALRSLNGEMESMLTLRANIRDIDNVKEKFIKLLNYNANNNKTQRREKNNVEKVIKKGKSKLDKIFNDININLSNRDRLLKIFDKKDISDIDLFDAIDGFEETKKIISKYLYMIKALGITYIEYNNSDNDKAAIINNNTKLISNFIKMIDNYFKNNKNVKINNHKFEELILDVQKLNELTSTDIYQKYCECILLKSNDCKELKKYYGTLKITIPINMKMFINMILSSEFKNKNQVNKSYMYSIITTANSINKNALENMILDNFGCYEHQISEYMNNHFEILDTISKTMEQIFQDGPFLNMANLYDHVEKIYINRGDKTQLIITSKYALDAIKELKRVFNRFPTIPKTWVSEIDSYLLQETAYNYDFLSLAGVLEFKNLKQFRAFDEIDTEDIFNIALSYFKKEKVELYYEEYSDKIVNKEISSIDDFEDIFKTTWTFIDTINFYIYLICLLNYMKDLNHYKTLSYIPDKVSNFQDHFAGYENYLQRPISYLKRYNPKMNRLTPEKIGSDLKRINLREIMKRYEVKKSIKFDAIYDNDGKKKIRIDNSIIIMFEKYEYLEKAKDIINTYFTIDNPNGYVQIMIDKFLKITLGNGIYLSYNNSSDLSPSNFITHLINDDGEDVEIYLDIVNFMYKKGIRSDNLYNISISLGLFISCIPHLTLDTNNVIIFPDFDEIIMNHSENDSEYLSYKVISEIELNPIFKESLNNLLDNNQVENGEKWYNEGKPFGDESVSPIPDERVSPRSDQRVSPRSDERVSPRSDERVSPRSDERFIDERVSPRSDERVSQIPDERFIDYRIPLKSNEYYLNYRIPQIPQDLIPPKSDEDMKDLQMKAEKEAEYFLTYKFFSFRDKIIPVNFVQIINWCNLYCYLILKEDYFSLIILDFINTIDYHLDMLYQLLISFYIHKMEEGANLRSVTSVLTKYLKHNFSRENHMFLNSINQYRDHLKEILPYSKNDEYFYNDGLQIRLLDNKMVFLKYVPAYQSYVEIFVIDHYDENGNRVAKGKKIPVIVPEVRGGTVFYDELNVNTIKYDIIPSTMNDTE